MSKKGGIVTCYMGNTVASHGVADPNGIFQLEMFANAQQVVPKLLPSKWLAIA
jgi:hypothetical protein